MQHIFAQTSPEMVASLNALYVYACTAQGKSAVRESAAARFCIRFAARDKDYLFTEADCAKFDSMIGMSEVGVTSLGVCAPLIHRGAALASTTLCGLADWLCTVSTAQSLQERLVPGSL